MLNFPEMLHEDHPEKELLTNQGKKCYNVQDKAWSEMERYGA